MKEEHVDTVLVVVESSTKSIEAGRRAAEIAGKVGRVIVVANRVGDEAEFEAIRAALGEHEYVNVPDDPAIRRADKDGVAPIDSAPESPGVTAIGALAEKLSSSRSPA